MAEITDRESFEEWLEGKPKEWAQVLAVRSALRVLPLVGQVFNSDKNSSEIPQYLIFICIRASVISWGARKYPPHDMTDAANAATAAIANAAAASDAAAMAAADAGYAAADAAADAAARAAARAANATAFAANAAYAARDAADAAADVWGAINRDVKYLENHKGGPEASAQALAEQALWVNDQGAVATPEWALVDFKNLVQKLSDLNDNWQVWIEWYQSRLDGVESWGFNPENAETLMLRIAQNNKDWWKQGPSIVNAEIAGWLDKLRKEDEAKPAIFISYSTKNENAAKDVGQVIENLDHLVFAQYQDMPIGSNFVTQMQDGLENMGRMVALYSPEYLASEIC